MRDDRKVHKQSRHWKGQPMCGSRTSVAYDTLLRCATRQLQEVHVTADDSAVTCRTCLAWLGRGKNR